MLLLTVDDDVEDIDDGMRVRGLALRMRTLNSVLMSGLTGDDGRETREMENAVSGSA